MNRIAKGELPKMKAADIKAALPFEVTSDGEVIAQVAAPGQAEEDVGKFKTKCPNCGLVYQGQKPDNKPNFLSMQQKVVGGDDHGK